jgi:hypothetical protein
MDEEEIIFNEQTTQNLEIETGLEGIESAKRNYALREIELKKPALIYEERGVGVYCEAKGFEGREDTRSRKMCQSHQLSRRR